MEIFVKIQVTKSDPKRTREWKVPFLMPNRVKVVGFINPISKFSVFKIQFATPKWKQHFQCTLRNNLEMGFINPTKVKIKVVG